MCPRPQLDRNVFGAAVGGPIKKDKLFYFLNWEGRRDASAATVLRTVPTATFRQGSVLYGSTSGAVKTMTPDQIKAADPAGIGVDAAVLSYLQQYPLPNAFNTGDGINTAGYRFNASEPLRSQHLHREDRLSAQPQEHRLLSGGSPKPELRDNVPQFPGDPANGVYLKTARVWRLG